MNPLDKVLQDQNITLFTKSLKNPQMVSNEKFSSVEDVAAKIESIKTALQSANCGDVRVEYVVRKDDSLSIMIPKTDYEKAAQKMLKSAVTDKPSATSSFGREIKTARTENPIETARAILKELLSGWSREGAAASKPLLENFPFLEFLRDYDVEQEGRGFVIISRDLLKYNEDGVRTSMDKSSFNEFLEALRKAKKTYDAEVEKSAAVPFPKEAPKSAPPPKLTALSTPSSLPRVETAKNILYDIFSGWSKAGEKASKPLIARFPYLEFFRDYDFQQKRNGYEIISSNRMKMDDVRTITVDNATFEELFKALENAKRTYDSEIEKIDW